MTWHPPKGPRDPVRHAQIVAWAAEGLTLRETARRLGITPETVYQYALSNEVVFRGCPILEARIKTGNTNRRKKFKPHAIWRCKKRLPVERRFCGTCGDEIPVKTHPGLSFTCPRCGTVSWIIHCRYCRRRFAYAPSLVGRRPMYCGRSCKATAGYRKRRYRGHPGSGRSAPIPSPAEIIERA